MNPSELTASIFSTVSQILVLLFALGYFSTRAFYYRFLFTWVSSLLEAPRASSSQEIGASAPEAPAHCERSHASAPEAKAPKPAQAPKSSFSRSVSAPTGGKYSSLSDGDIHDTLATMMLCNIPYKATLAVVHNSLDSNGFVGLYDSVRLPSGAQAERNMGYAFVKFKSTEDADRFAIAFENFQFPGGSQRRCTVKPAAQQASNGKTKAKVRRKTTNGQSMLRRGESSPAKVSSVNVFLCPLPEDICGRIACLVGFQGVGTLGGCDKKLQSEVWESREVWMALSISTDLATSFRPHMSGRDACDEFRRATFRTDLSRLRSLDKVGRWQPILDEAAHVACGLLPGDVALSDLADFIKIGSRCLGAHDPESAAANRAAERLLRASRRCMELFTEEQLEHLEYAYKSVHQLHSLMLSSMQESHEGLLQQSMWSHAPDPMPDEEPLQRSSGSSRAPAPMPKQK